MTRTSGYLVQTPTEYVWFAKWLDVFYWLKSTNNMDNKYIVIEPCAKEEK